MSFEGHTRRESHRTKGERALCLICSDNCSPDIPCLCCGELMYEWRVAELEAENEQLKRKFTKLETDIKIMMRYFEEEYYEASMRSVRNTAYAVLAILVSSVLLATLVTVL